MYSLFIQHPPKATRKGGFFLHEIHVLRVINSPEKTPLLKVNRFNISAIEYSLHIKSVKILFE